MRLPRTPTPEDAAALRYAGLLGHRYITVRTYNAGGPHGGRTMAIESDRLPTIVDVRGYTDPKTYERYRTKRGDLRFRRVL